MLLGNVYVELRDDGVKLTSSTHMDPEGRPTGRKLLRPCHVLVPADTPLHQALAYLVKNLQDAQVSP